MLRVERGQVRADACKTRRFFLQLRSGTLIVAELHGDLERQAQPVIQNRSVACVERHVQARAATVCPTSSPKHSGGPQMGKMKLEVAEASSGAVIRKITGFAVVLGLRQCGNPSDAKRKAHVTQLQEWIQADVNRPCPRPAPDPRPAQPLCRNRPRPCNTLATKMPLALPGLLACCEKQTSAFFL